MIREQNPAVVIDSGSELCQAGISGEDAPRCCFPIQAITMNFQVIPTTVDILKYYHTAAWASNEIKRGVLKLGCPNQDGIKKNWNGILLIAYERYGKNLAPYLIHRTQDLS